MSSSALFRLLLEYHVPISRVLGHQNPRKLYGERKKLRSVET